MTVIAVGLQLAADPDEFKAGPIGLLLLVLMGVSIIFLVRSMTKHLRKVPASFDRKPESPEPKSDPDDPDRGPATS